MSSAGPTAAPVEAAEPSRRGRLPVVVVAGLGAPVVAAVACAALTGGGALPAVRGAVLALLALAAATVLGGTAAAVRTAPGDPQRDRLLDAAAIAAGVQTVLAAATAFLLYLATAPAPDDPSFGPGLVAFVADVPVGRTWGIAAAAAAVLTALLVAVRSRTGVRALWPLAAVALAPVAVQSSIGGGSIGVTRSATAAVLVLLLAVGTWTGTAGLAVLRVVPAPRRTALVATAAAGIAAASSWASLRAVGDASGVGAVALVLLLLVGAAVAVRGLPGLQTLLLAVLAALGAVAVVTRALPDAAPRTTPAAILTGAPLPSPASAGTLLAGWRPDALWLVVCVGLLVGYSLAVRRAGGRWPRMRAASWTAGVLLLAWLTSGGPAVYQEVLFGVHLAQQLAVLLLVPVLLGGGAPLRLAAAAELRPSLPTARPVASGLLALVVVLVVGAGPVLRWSIADPVGTEACLAAALLAGAWLVRSISAPRTRRGRAVGVVIALLVLEVLGAGLLAAGTSLVLADWYGAMGWGVDAAAAQRASAVVVLPVAVLPTVVLLVRALRTPAVAPVTTPGAAATA